MKLNNGLSLDLLVDNPSRISMLDPASARDVLISLASIHPVLIQRALAPSVSRTDEDGLLTMNEVAVKLKISEDKAYELVRQGALQSIHMGRLVRVKPSSLAEYVARSSH